MTGWGRTSENSPTATILQETSVTVYTRCNFEILFVNYKSNVRATCSAAYSGSTEDMICAGLPHGLKDTCSGKLYIYLRDELRKPMLMI